MPSTITKRSQYVKVGDKIRFNGRFYLVKGVKVSVNNEVQVSIDSVDYSVLYFYASDTVDILQTRACHPCFDTDCECIWDVVS